jgi:uncharacterized RDD family membrane protein YckC
MSDEMNDPLLERLGPFTIRLLAIIAAGLIIVPLALVLIAPLLV